MNRPEQAIPLFKVYMNPSAKDAACEVLDSGYIGQGPKVDEFENEIHKLKSEISKAKEIINPI